MYDPYDTPLTTEEALTLDAEKLRALTGEDHYFMVYDPDVWIADEMMEQREK